MSAEGVKMTEHLTNCMLSFCYGLIATGIAFLLASILSTLRKHFFREGGIRFTKKP